MKGFLIPLAAVALLAACSSEKDMPAPQTDPPPEANPYKVTLSEALAKADAVLRKLDGEQTRSLPRSVKSVGAIKKMMTRSAASSTAPDTMFYIVNYGDDRGFAILSGDKRLAPIYAISEEGSFNIADTSFNVGLKMYMDGLMSINSEEIDSLPDGPPNDGPELISTTGTGPFLDATVRRWGQESPFNLFCPEIDGQHCPVGCVPLAVGMVLSTFELPKTIDGLNLDWSAMKTNPDEPILAKFFAKLGQPKYFNVHYRLSGTSTRGDSILPALNQLGYLVYYSNSLTCNNVFDLISSFPHPLLVVAKMDATGDPDTDPAHAFVCDGILEARWKGGQELAPGEPAYYFTSRYVHFVWGWNGVNNGYYLWDNGASINTAYPNLFDKDDDPYYYDIESFYNFWWFYNWQPFCFN